jgi:hypothetical protein
MSYNKEVIFSYKQQSNEWLVDAWERFRVIAYGGEHGLRDWMIMHTTIIFQQNLSLMLTLKVENPFLELTAAKAQTLLDGLLLEKKIHDILDKTDIPCEPFDDRYEIYDLHEEKERVEEVKMLSDNIKEHLLDLDKCSLNKLINILQSFANDPSFNVHQTCFGS